MVSGPLRWKAQPAWLVWATIRARETAAIVQLAQSAQLSSVHREQALGPRLDQAPAEQSGVGRMADELMASS